MVRSSGRPRRAVQVGIVLFVLGLIFVAIDVLPFFFDDHNTPLWLNLACLSAPIGFGIAIWSGLAAGRAEQRAAAAATRATRPGGN